MTILLAHGKARWSYAASKLMESALDIIVLPDYQSLLLDLQYRWSQDRRIRNGYSNICAASTGMKTLQFTEMDHKPVLLHIDEVVDCVINLETPEAFKKS